ncbi:hypothetical protein [Nostoc sp. CMAA1605]|uniref:hypothetical protein n=1 Tax=Nostoc sp. CMAA1605 TaxID=2055159 RepID=UPI001F40E94E|nr:hypothetical protein [Nostoc sp. CMAA1605]MCF4969731.1 hypothetical protein [Nostoc sp. CMAA1605]
MPENPNQPREYDAVLGGQAAPPVNGLVLGGIAGIQDRIFDHNLETKIAAMTSAIAYGDAGLELVIQSLQNETLDLKIVGYKLLHQRKKLLLNRLLQRSIHTIINFLNA